MSDLISKTEALALIETMMETYWDRKQILSIVRNGIEKLPSAQQWIPTSERLPSYGEDVLLSIGRYVNVGYLVQVSDDEGHYNWFYSGWYHPLSEVDAWLPLPEPYKGGEA